MELKNKTVMITGGSSGIGLEMAKSFVQEGANVLICARTGPQLDQVKKENPRLEVYGCDLSKPSEVTDLINKTGVRIDIWINNAGIFQQYNLVNPDQSFDVLQNELNINFVAASLAITALVPILKSKQESAIVNITSGMAFVPKAMFPMYSASKAALHSFVLSVRAQLTESSIRIIEVVPQQVDTKLTAEIKGQKVSTAVVAASVLNALKTNQDLVLIGTSKKLVWMSRFFPEKVLKSMNSNS